jgi:hypothetical protein
MNIIQELDKRNIDYEIYEDGTMLRFTDAQDNLGVLLQFDRFELRYHFWDANGASYSPDHPFIDLDEMFAEFDKLILIYYCDDNAAAFDAYFANWKPMEGVSHE